ncbi:MAG TPA: hypothetical protein VF557_07425 [Jatrophihabitans sp.]|jgi:hypothetical protein|uniref:hypothetical protein n=1 Tax=Jatrophihabitans sp. TaxID=1932789 RepID=UPI002F1433CA
MMARNTRELAGSLVAARVGSGGGLSIAPLVAGIRWIEPAVVPAAWVRLATPGTNPLAFPPLLLGRNPPGLPLSILCRLDVVVSEAVGATDRPDPVGGAIVRRATPVVGASSAEDRAVASPSA